jgi:hypothetical protein
MGTARVKGKVWAERRSVPITNASADAVERVEPAAIGLHEAALLPQMHSHWPGRVPRTQWPQARRPK